jgi:hypothetical protein
MSFLESVDLNKILCREHVEHQIREILLSFEQNKNDSQFKKGIYIYGSSGIGKTVFVKKILQSMNYEILHYDAGTMRNKTFIDSITSNNMSSLSIQRTQDGRHKSIAIIMDEMDGMNNGDKGSINALIKLIRQKKTKKQKLESKTLNPIICIGNYFIDKKIKELMKVCHVIELTPPTDSQMLHLVEMVQATSPTTVVPNSIIHNYVVNYVQRDLRKLKFLIKWMSFKNDGVDSRPEETSSPTTTTHLFCLKTTNLNSSQLTQTLFKQDFLIKDHMLFNETDRTIISLLWHENMIDAIMNLQMTTKEKIKLYVEMLNHICFGDYIDRITFQYQIWKFNEMTSLIKILFTCYLYHKIINAHPRKSSLFVPETVRFTKILTKYSTEYNNHLFIQHMCHHFQMDKRDLICFFHEWNTTHASLPFNESVSQLETLIYNDNINKLDIKRFYNYIYTNIRHKTSVVEDITEDSDFEDAEIPIWE